MMLTGKNILRQIRDLFFFLVISLLQSYLMCPRCDTADRFLRIALFTFLMWILLWKGNSLLAKHVSGKISWIKYPLKRFLVGIAVTISYTVLVVLLLTKGFDFFSILTLGKHNLPTLYGAVIVTILISFFLHGRAFLIFWREASIEKEKFEKESITARYESLKNQVNPHFLFNSLNALTNLVYEDQEKAVKFIRKLSEVYRYVLDTREKEAVQLDDELKFIESYLYLQRIRFGDKLRVDISLKDHKIFVAPLALQMLIENAIKHNIVSEEDPLTIRVFSENGFLVVENNLQRKTVLNDESPVGLGLENITRRYEFLTNKKVEIAEDENRFAVKLPVLNALHS